MESLIVLVLVMAFVGYDVAEIYVERKLFKEKMKRREKALEGEDLHGRRDQQKGGTEKKRGGNFKWRISSLVKKIHPKLSEEG